MPIIDSTTGKSNAERLLQYWSGKLLSMHAEDIAGVRMVCTNGKKDEWDIILEVYVSESSKAYKDFMKRFV